MNNFKIDRIKYTLILSQFMGLLHENIGNYMRFGKILAAQTSS